MNTGDSTAPRIEGPAPLLTIRQAADLLGVSYWTVRSWIEAGKLRAIRLPGRLIRVHPRDLDRFIEANRG
jgi:excisionase family DNA binding protein